MEDGIKAVSGGVKVTVADQQHFAEVVPRLLQVLSEYDLVMGSGYCKGGSAGTWKI